MIADVVIIGGGLAGLSAAVKLANSGAKVFLYEQNTQLGGRTYSFIDKKTGDVVDNGQHLLIGAYHNTLEYLKLIGTDSLLNKQTKPKLNFYHPKYGISTFEISNLPKPFDITAAMLKYSPFSFRERHKLLKVGFALRKLDATPENKLAHQSVEEWLISLDQSETVRHSFWYPIVVSVMNELPNRASAMLFAQSLKKSFLGKKSDAALLIPLVGQTELYINEAEIFLSKNKVKIIKGNGVKHIIVENGKVIGVATDRNIKSKYIISAIPYFKLPDILPRDVMHKYPFDKLKLFKSVPIISINLWFDRDVMDIDFVGLINKNLQWVFNKHRIMGEAHKPDNYITAIISGAHKYIHLTKDELVSLAIKDLTEVFPMIKTAILKHSIVIKEKRATFSATSDIEQYRPNYETPIENLFLTGDWTNTGLPATIEGAVQSGFECVRLISEREG
jgi:squalene-associated FAD-dependent desaturase